jgi:ATP-dependent protease Clp ATPase subunit
LAALTARYPRKVIKKQTREETEKMTIEGKIPQNMKDDLVNQLIDFIEEESPKTIKAKLDEHIINQENLTSVVAEFAYYHVLRMFYPELPVKSLLIAGKSGTGKTECMRVLQRLFPCIPVLIFDASRLTSEGYKGEIKVGTILKNAADLSQGVNNTIIVFDEFDKAVVPAYSSQGQNYSLLTQNELLKVLEGELWYKEKGKKIALDRFGYVFCGAFEQIFIDRERRKNTNPIGFGSMEEGSVRSDEVMPVTEKEFRDFGIRAELLGRIAWTVTCNSLGKEDFKRIALNENGRIQMFRDLLTTYGTDNPLTVELMDELVEKNYSDQVGVRKFLSQCESVMLEQLLEDGIAIKERDFIKNFLHEDEIEAPEYQKDMEQKEDDSADCEEQGSQNENQHGEDVAESTKQERTYGERREDIWRSARYSHRRYCLKDLDWTLNAMPETAVYEVAQYLRNFRYVPCLRQEDDVDFLYYIALLHLLYDMFGPLDWKMLLEFFCDGRKSVEQCLERAGGLSRAKQIYGIIGSDITERAFHVVQAQLKILYIEDKEKKY